MIPDEAIRSLVLAESDRRDREQERLLNNWRAGYAAAERAVSDAYEAGFADALTTVKRGHHDTYRAAQQLRDWVIAEETAEAVRWELRGEPRTRETFSQPHPDDYTGSPVPAW